MARHGERVNAAMPLVRFSNEYRSRRAMRSAAADFQPEHFQESSSDPDVTFDHNC